MNISVTQGARSSATIGTETRNRRDVEKFIQQLEPEAGPLTQILSRLRAETYTNRKVEWFEDARLPEFDVLTADLAAADATMTVANYKYFRKDDLVIVNNFEQVRVSATPTTAAVAITRAFGDRAATDAVAGAQLILTSSATQEGATYRDQLSTLKAPKYNLCQSIMSPSSWTEVDQATGVFGEDEVVAEHQKMVIEQKVKMEKAILFGRPYDDQSTDPPTAAMGGLEYFIQTNVVDVSAGFTEPEFENFVRIWFRYGAKQKLLFCSSYGIVAINGFSRSKLQTFSDESTYGVTMTEYKNSGKRVMLIEQVLLENASLSDPAGVAGHAIGVDPNQIKMGYLKGLQNRIQERLENPGSQTRIDECRGHMSLKVMNEQKFAILTGL